MTDRFTLEEKAHESFFRLMQAARECRAQFDAAHVALPERLRRFLDEASVAPKQVDPRVIVSPPESPPRPSEWQHDWIWVPVGEMTPTSLVRGLLRGAIAGMTPTEIADAITRLGGNANKGSIANIGTRLSNSGEITRENGSWCLVTRDKAPVLHDGFVWGPVEAFDKQEVAAHRRLGVRHLLQAYPDGLQTVQITRMLGKCDWMRAPNTKDLIKVDLQELQAAQKAKRVGNSGKWKAT